MRVMFGRIMKGILVPLLQFVKKWIYHGELNDPYDEFFIKENLKATPDNFWKQRYFLDYSLIPAFMDEALADDILLAGKSVNFLIRQCGVSDWMLDLKLVDISASIDQYDNIKDWVSTAATITSTKLINIMFDKFYLKRHLESIKGFLLLGYGDF